VRVLLDPHASHNMDLTPTWRRPSVLASPWAWLDSDIISTIPVAGNAAGLADRNCAHGPLKIQEPFHPIARIGMNPIICLFRMICPHGMNPQVIYSWALAL
jgi:hypothetical protein